MTKYLITCIRAPSFSKFKTKQEEVQGNKGRTIVNPRIQVLKTTALTLIDKFKMTLLLSLSLKS